MIKIELDIIALTHSITQNNSFAVVLGERVGNRRLPIVIGPFEAQAIAAAREKVQPVRPLTHDLLKNICAEFSIKLQEVIISNLVEGVFYATLVCERLGEIIEIDARTSDAIALAVRFDTAIYTYEFIIEQAGIAVEEPQEGSRRNVAKESRTNVETNDFSRLALDKLNTLLQEAIEKEDYERAARIRDEINHRS